MDYGNSSYRGNCFEFVMQRFSLSFDQTLRKIDEDFGLGLSNRPIGISTPFYREPLEKDRALRTIQVLPKQFTNKELKFWSDYYQGFPELKSENIYSVDKLFLDKQRFTLQDNEMVFGYLYENKYWKIYQPLKTGRGKWISTVPLQVMDGLEEIKNCRNVIVTKSKKDKMVIRHLLPDVCSVQNESLAAFSDDSIAWLKGEIRGNVYINFDCDSPGVENSWKVTSEFGFKHLNVPYSYLQEGTKDFAEMARKYGLRKVQEYLKEKQLL